MKHPAIATLPLLLSFACGPPVEPDGTPGALHIGAFAYCETSDTCDDSPFPARIAVGTSFVVSFSEDDVRVGSDERLFDATKNDDGSVTFRALAEGDAKITASDETGTLLDFVTLSTSDVTALEVAQCPRSFNAIRRPDDDDFDPRDCAGARPTTALELSRGASLAPTLCLSLLDGAGNELGGAPDATWSVKSVPTPEHAMVPPNPTAMLQLEVGGDARCASVGALTLGDARLSVSATGLTTAVSVTAVP